MFNLEELFTDLLEKNLEETEILFETEDGEGTFEVTGSYKSKCDCCDKNILFLTGTKL